MKIFVSYGDWHDHWLALKLQDIAASTELKVYVPRRQTRLGNVSMIDPETARELDEAELVLGVVGAGYSETCRSELNLGLALNKKALVICYPEFVDQLRPSFHKNLVVANPADPDCSSMTTALLALSSLALGLLLVSPLYALPTTNIKPAVQ